MVPKGPPQEGREKGGGREGKRTLLPPDLGALFQIIHSLYRTMGSSTRNKLKGKLVRGCIINESSPLFPMATKKFSDQHAGWAYYERRNLKNLLPKFGKRLDVKEKEFLFKEAEISGLQISCWKAGFVIL